MLRAWVLGLAALLMAATAASAEAVTKFTLPSGTKILVEILGKAKNRSANRLVMYAAVRVAGVEMTEPRANAIADETFEFLLGGMAVASNCDAALVTVDRVSVTPRPYTSYYATLTPLNFRVEGRKETPPEPPYNRQGPLALPSGKTVYIDRQFDGQANYNDKAAPAVFGEFDVNGEPLDSSTKYSLLREFWLTQMKAHADQIGAGAFRVVLNEKLPESRFDFGRRSYLFFNKRKDGEWPSLPEKAAMATGGNSSVGFGEGSDAPPSETPAIGPAQHH
jgi:hypothetical protein